MRTDKLAVHLLAKASHDFADPHAAMLQARTAQPRLTRLQLDPVRQVQHPVRVVLWVDVLHR